MSKKFETLLREENYLMKTQKFIAVIMLMIEIKGEYLLLEDYKITVRVKSTFL